MSSRRWRPPTPEELQARLPQYEITEMIGRGGMGAVYKGWQRSLGRFVAIKILPPGFEGGEEDFAGRFKREGQALAQLSHPGIIHVHDAGERADGLLYFVMDYVVGTDLHMVLAARGRLPAEEAVGITMQVLDALAYAHEHGVIHRDIKPANIMIDEGGRVKVADFGLAKSTAEADARITSSNVTIGTPDFMAPEALKGAANADHRADLFAVGVMLYEMLTGQLPRGRFESPSRAVPGLDKRFDRIVNRALESDPEARYASAADFRAALAPLLTRGEGRRTVANRPAGKRTAHRTVARRKTTPPVDLRPERRITLAGIVALIVVGLGCWIVWKMLHATVPPARGKSGGGAHPDAAGGVPADVSGPWQDAFAESPLKEFLGSAKYSARGYLLPSGNHWKYPAQAVSAGALRVRVTTEDSRMILNFHHDDGGQGGAARVFFRPGRCLLVFNTRNDAPNALIAEKGDVKLTESAHDFLLARIEGRLRVVLDGQTVLEAADPVTLRGRFSFETGSDSRIHLEKAEYLTLDGVPAADALKMLGLPPR